MPAPIRIDPRGEPVTVSGVMLQPDARPLKIDVWRHVRHPPPELVHVFGVKKLDESTDEFFPAGHPATLVGKVISWVWVTQSPQGPYAGPWRVLLDVRQGGESVPGYPSELSGAGEEIEGAFGRLKISQHVEERMRL